VTAIASLLVGALLGAVYAAASLAAVRRARTMAPTDALRFMMRGMLVRMALVLAAFAAVLTWAPVQRGPFVLGLGLLFVAGLLAEAVLVLRRPAAA